MTAHTDARSTRYTFLITVTVFVALILGGLIVGTAVWPKAHAASGSIAAPRSATGALVSNVGATKLPAAEIADLF